MRNKSFVAFRNRFMIGKPAVERRFYRYIGLFFNGGFLPDLEVGKAAIRQWSWHGNLVGLLGVDIPGIGLDRGNALASISIRLNRYW